MNHVAFDVAPERIDEYRSYLVAAGIPCTEVANHDDSEWGISEGLHPGVFVRSVYFQDPDGILLEFACWIRDFVPGDVAHAPAKAVKGKDAVMAAAAPDPDLKRPAPDPSKRSTTHTTHTTQDPLTPTHAPPPPGPQGPSHRPHRHHHVRVALRGP
jgi:hypothetical protein